MKDASLTGMENEGNILYSQGTSSQNKESSLMAKRVIPYCLIFIESTHMLDDGKIHSRHTHSLCPLRHYIPQTSIFLVSGAQYTRLVPPTLKRSKVTKARVQGIKKEGSKLLSFGIFTVPCKCCPSVKLKVGIARAHSCRVAVTQFLMLSSVGNIHHKLYLPLPHFQYML